VPVVLCPILPLRKAWTGFSATTGATARLCDLPLLRGSRPPKPSGIRLVITAAGDRINLVMGKETIQPFEVVHADFTEVVYANGRRKAKLIPFIDHTTKLVLGWAVGEHAVTPLALAAWNRARRSLRQVRAHLPLHRHGVPLEQVIAHHDQDPMFTGYAWTSRLPPCGDYPLLTDHVRVSCALNGARDNPEMEAFNSRFKTE